MKLIRINKKFDGREIIKNFSCEIKKGNAYLMRDASGTGKTTLIRIMCGLEDADKGEVEDGFKSYSVAFQEHRLIGGMSALENLELFTGKSREELIHAIKMFNLENVMMSYSEELSGGEAQRFNIIRAIEADSECVILDEPLKELDEANKETALKYIFKNIRGRALIIVSHDYRKEFESMNEIFITG